MSKWFVAVLVVLSGVLGCSPGFAQTSEELVPSDARPRWTPGFARTGEDPLRYRATRRWTDEDLIEAVRNSRSVNQVFTHLGLTVGGGQWAFVKRRIAELNLDTSHFKFQRIHYTDEQLVAAVQRSESMTAVVLALGGDPDSGSVTRRIKARILVLELSTSHFTGQGWNRGARRQPLRPYPRIPLEEILVEDSRYTSTVALKERLIEVGLLENRCALCKLGPEWRWKRLVMRLDHINGVRNDNRLVNLRLVCPNCDSQLDTFAGRNKSSNRERRGLAPLPDTPR